MKVIRYAFCNTAQKYKNKDKYEAHACGSVCKQQCLFLVIDIKLSASKNELPVDWTVILPDQHFETFHVVLAGVCV